MRRPFAVLAALALAAPAGAQTRLWREDERVVITDFSTVQAVAVSDAMVYVATTNGLGLYDRRFNTWQPPVTWADGYPRERILSALADPAEDAVWLGTTAGVVRYRWLLRQFDAVAVPGGVRELMYDRNDPFGGLFLLTPGGWQYLPRGAFIPGPAPLPPPGRWVAPLPVEGVMRRAPVVDAMQGAVLLDDRLRSYRYTCAAKPGDVEEYYLGTDGMGLVKVDPLMATFQPLPFGLLGPGAASVLAVPGGVWVGSDEQGARSGLTRVSDDLQQYDYEEGPRGTAFGASVVRALMARGRAIWAATDRGIVQVEPGNFTARVTTANGLRDDETYALAQGPSGVWVGTARGLGFLPADSAEVRSPEGPSVPVLALSAARDTVWIGSTEGLGLAAAGGDVYIVAGADTVPELRSAIVAVTRVADTLVAATTTRVLWRPAGGTWLVERAVSADLGTIRALAADSGGVWIGGTGGLARYSFATRAFTVLRAPGDLPGPVRGIATSRRYVWVATEGGLVRFKREAIEP